MAITLDAFANQMSDEAGEDYTDAGVAAIYKRWAKEAYINTAGAARFLWMNETFALVTSSSLAEYTLDPTVAEVKAIRNTTTDSLIGYTTEETLSRLGTDFEEEAAPKYWFYSGIDSTSTAFKIQLVPVPDASYTLDVRTLIRTDDLSDSSVIPLPPEFVELMRVYVRYMYQLNDDNAGLAQQNFEMYNSRLLAYISRYNTPRRAGSRLKIKRTAGTMQAPAAGSE